MSSSKMTIIGIENYLNTFNDSLFKDIILPEDIVKDDLVNTILMRSGEFEVLYPQPDFLKNAITLWSRKNNRTFTKWITALNIEYNPLENYDRMEDWTDNNTSNATDESQKTVNGTVTDNGSIVDEGITRNTGTVDNISHTDDVNVTTNSRSAYDSESFVNDTRTNVDIDTDLSSTQTNNLSETINNTKTNNNSQVSDSMEDFNNSHTENETNHRTGRAHGNIGVTTSQQMLESELDIARWNIYDQIADLFITEFCIMVY